MSHHEHRHEWVNGVCKSPGCSYALEAREFAATNSYGREVRYPDPPPDLRSIAAELAAALRRVRGAVIADCPDTLWVGPAETAVDCMDAALARYEAAAKPGNQK